MARTRLQHSTEESNSSIIILRSRNTDSPASCQDNFFDRSVSSYELVQSQGCRSSKPISDISVEYDNSQIKYNYPSEELADTETRYGFQPLSNDTPKLENRYLKNDITRFLSLKKLRSRKGSIQTWKKASKQEVINKLSDLRKQLIKG